MIETTTMLEGQFSGETSFVPSSAQSMDSSEWFTTPVSRQGGYGNGLSEECAAFAKEVRENQTTAPTSVSDPAIRIVFASATLVENGVVLIALLVSWKSLRQNIYIFALSIIALNCFLGLTHILNSVFAGVISSSNMEVKTIHAGMGPASWFYLIRASALFTAQVASTGTAALLAVAFKRYVYALTPSQIPNVNSNGDGSTTAKLFSRKTSSIMTSVVCLLCMLLGIIPLFWNCGGQCSCFIDAGVDRDHIQAAKCFEKHGCSYLFPPLKSASAILFLVVFFVSLSVLIVSTAQVINMAGGCIALLPYNLHKYYARRRHSSVDAPSNIHRRLRKRSVQMNYMRDMIHFMMAITVTYFLCRLPAALLVLVESVTTYTLNISQSAVTIIILWSYFDAILIPIIFTATLHGMKEALKKLLTPCCTKTLTVTIGKELHSASSHPEAHESAV